MPEVFRGKWRRTKFVRPDNGQEETRYKECLSMLIPLYYAAHGRVVIAADGQPLRVPPEAMSEEFWGRPGPGGDSFVTEAQRAGLLHDVPHDAGSPAPAIQHPTKSSAIGRIEAERSKRRAAGFKGSDFDLDLKIFADDPKLYNNYVSQNTRRVRGGDDEARP
jgi:hypothetical protein